MFWQGFFRRFILTNVNANLHIWRHMSRHWTEKYLNNVRCILILEDVKEMKSWCEFWNKNWNIFLVWTNNTMHWSGVYPVMVFMFTQTVGLELRIGCLFLENRCCNFKSLEDKASAMSIAVEHLYRNGVLDNTSVTFR